MKFNRLRTFSFSFSLAVAALSAPCAHAIAISSMFGFAENNAGKFTVTNTENMRQFIQVGISEIEVKNGQLVELPYTRENIAQWRLSVLPGRTVIEPQLKKDFRVVYQPKKGDHSATSDHVFKLSFVPTPYFRGEKPENYMQIAIGFAPYFIVPAQQDKPLKYNVLHGGNALEIENTGKTYIRTTISSCPKKKLSEKERAACEQTVYVLSGRKLKVDLTPSMQKAKTLALKLSTHFDTYQTKLSLAPLQRRTN